MQAAPKRLALDTVEGREHLTEGYQALSAEFVATSDGKGSVSTREHGVGPVISIPLGIKPSGPKSNGNSGSVEHSASGDEDMLAVQEVEENELVEDKPDEDGPEGSIGEPEVIVLIVVEVSNMEEVECDKTDCEGSPCDVGSCEDLDSSGSCS